MSSTHTATIKLSTGEFATVTVQVTRDGDVRGTYDDFEIASAVLLDGETDEPVGEATLSSEDERAAVAAVIAARDQAEDDRRLGIV